MIKHVRIEIRYCTKCRWLLRAAWIAQEILTTFEDKIDEVALVPDTEQGGIFDIAVNSNIIWSRSVKKRFPEAKEFKSLVRDIISPEMNLGHIDR